MIKMKNRRRLFSSWLHCVEKLHEPCQLEFPRSASLERLQLEINSASRYKHKGQKKWVRCQFCVHLQEAWKIA